MQMKLTIQIQSTCPREANKWIPNISILPIGTRLKGSILTIH